MTVPSYIPLQLPTTYRRYTRQEGSIAFASGKVSNPLPIDQSGTLLSLLCTFSGSVSVPAGDPQPTLHAEAPFNLIKRVNLTGGGPGRVVSLPLYPLALFERLREADFVPSYSWAPAAGGGGAVVTPVDFDFVIPICVRDGDLVGEWSDYLGAIYTGDQQLQLSLGIEWNTEADVFANQSSSLGTITGTLAVTSFKLDTPRPSADASLLTAVSWSHQFIAEQEGIPITGAGPLSTLPDLPSAQPRAYLRILDITRNGATAVPTAGMIATIDAEVQDTVDFERDVPAQVWLARSKRRYGSVAALPPGTYPLDFAAGNRRDNWLPVGNVNLFRVRPVIASGLSLTSATYSRYSEIVVPSALASKFMQEAAANGVLAKLTAGAAA